MSREKLKRADYVLYLGPNNPITIVEAKDNKYSVGFGLQQAITYAKMLDLPFVEYIKNTTDFVVIKVGKKYLINAYSFLLGIMEKESCNATLFFGEYYLLIKEVHLIIRELDKMVKLALML